MFYGMIVRLFIYPVTHLHSSKKRGIYARYRIIQATLATHLNTYFINICSRDKRICYNRDLNQYFLESPYNKCKSRYTRFCVCDYVCHCHTTRDVDNKPFSKAQMDVVFDRFVHHPECFVVISTSYIMLLVLRMMTAIVTGVLISLAMIVASETIPIAKRGLAISFVFGGFTLANVIGVPIGTVIADWYDWNATFLLTTFLGGIAFLASFFILPTMHSTFRSSMREQFSLLTHPRILMAFFIPSLGFGATYAVYTYLVPILKGMEAPSSSISLILFGYGFISIFSNILAGKIASYNAIGRLRFVFLVQAIVLISLYWTTDNFIFGLVNISLMSLMAILLTTSTQLYLIDLAVIYQPKATGLAASLMPVASNVGIAFGSALGGIVYHQGNLMSVTLVGGLVAIFASLLTFLSHRLDQKQKKPA